MLLTAAIIGYILSNILALALLFTGKKIGPGWFRILASMHIFFGFIFLYNVSTNKEESPQYLSFLIFFCSGIITGGLALGTPAHIAFKIYFGIYCLSIFVFIVSPSTMLKFLTTASFNRGHQLIPVYQNYYLEKQGSSFNTDTVNVRYKLIEKKGMLHKTVVRDLDFKGTLDSIRILSIDENKALLIRGFTSFTSFVEDRTDSLDVEVNFSQSRQNKIERRL